MDFLELKNSGKIVIGATGEDFLRGYLAAYLQGKCEQGAFGKLLKNISPEMLGATAAILVQTVKNVVLMSIGKMTPREIGNASADSAIILAGCYLGGVIGQALGFGLPVLGYTLGSLLGASFAITYQFGKEKFISFCADTGFTCFGLVKQDYIIPNEILAQLGG